MSTDMAQDDEAMEWITDWDYERILPANEHNPAVVHAMDHADISGMRDDDDHDDDDDVDMMEEDDVDPLPLDAVNSNAHDSDSKEISIFWTRVSEDMTDEEFNGMFGLNGHERGSFTLPSSRRNSRDSLNLLDGGFVPSSLGAPATTEEPAAGAQGPARGLPLPHSVHAPDTASSYNVDDDDESIMSPLQEKEGLLPPMSPSQLYHQSNTQYGMIKSPSKYKHQDPVKTHSAHSATGSIATHTTTDMMDEETMSSSASAAYSHYNPHDSNGDIFERQQQLLQEVLQDAPQRNQSRRSSYELPRPSDHQQLLMQEMRQHKSGPSADTGKQAAASSETAPPAPSKQAASDPIFARQQQIFQQMRGPAKGAPAPQSEHPHHTTYPTPHHPGPQKHLTSPHGASSGSVDRTSPVSVTKTLTRAGMDSEEYQKVVTRLTEKNLMERQRSMLKESMKRSLETRQALHIKPTALPDYNHDKLSQVLKDIESSSRSISKTYAPR